jgi:hypothetical protein
MGFSQEFIDISISYTNSYNMNDLLAFMIKGDRGWEHDFIRNFYTANEINRCEICKDVAEEHADFNVPPPVNVHERQEEFKSMQDRVSVLFSSLLSDDEEIPSERCQICLYSINIPYSLPSCHHHSFCEACIRQYLEVLINDSKVLNIKCPGNKCTKEFESSDINSLVSPQIFEKFLKFKSRSELLKDPSIKWCIRADCEGYVKGEESEILKECPICSMQICLKCGKSWHPKKSCDEMIDMDYEAWAKGREIQPCPKCRHKIEKVDGCNHMTCAVCGYNWCWLCKGKYTSNHFSNLNPFGCPNLQSGYNTRENWPMWKIYCARIKGLCFWIMLVLFSPVIIVFGPAVYSVTMFNRNNYYRGLCYLVVCDVSVFLGSLAITPIGYALGIPFFTVYMVLRCIRR